MASEKQNRVQLPDNQMMQMNFDEPAQLEAGGNILLQQAFECFAPRNEKRVEKAEAGLLAFKWR